MAHNEDGSIIDCEINRSLRILCNCCFNISSIMRSLRDSDRILLHACQDIASVHKIKSNAIYFTICLL